MSATGRNKIGKERDPYDYYPTPAWCVDRLAEAVPSIRQRKRTVLEPCAGDGAILRALCRYNTGNDPGVEPGMFTAWEIQARFGAELSALAEEVCINSALVLAEQRDKWVVDARLVKPFDLAITNPPFGIAFDLLKALWPISQQIVFLLRLSFLASEERQPFLSAHPPSLYVLPNRPIFTQGTSDNCDYAWMRWEPWRSRLLRDDPERDARPTVRVLGCTPRVVRCPRDVKKERSAA